MNVALPIDQFNINNVFFQEAIKNTIMSDSNFIRIIYSDDICSLNGICICFKLQVTHVDKSFNKFKFTFDNVLSDNFIQAISKIEYDIISKFNIKNKQPIFRISEQLKNSIIKVTDIHNTATGTKPFMVKISGLWSNELEYGLTYKFTQC